MRDGYADGLVPRSEDDGREDDQVHHNGSDNRFRADAAHRRIQRDFVLTERQELIRIDPPSWRGQIEGQRELMR